MPRGNRKESLAVRLANHVPRGIVPAHEIPGSYEWAVLKHLEKGPDLYNEKERVERFFDGYTMEERAHYYTLLPHAFPASLETANETLIDNINRWVDSNGWQYVEGGDFNGSWVNPRYPNRIFTGMTLSLSVIGAVETVEFPMACSEEDPIGLACHVEIRNGGTSASILPNKWTQCDSTRRGRRIARSNASAIRRRKRWEEFHEAEKIKDPMRRKEAVHSLRSKFYENHILDEELDHELDMDYSYEEGN